MNGNTIISHSQDGVLVQYMLDCGCDLSRNGMGGTGRLVRDAVFFGFGLVDRWGSSVL